MLVESELRVAQLYRYKAQVEGGWEPEGMPELDLTAGGIVGDMHQGTARTLLPYQNPRLRGRRVPNDRQISIVDESDMRGVAEDMNLPINSIEDRVEDHISYWLAKMLGSNIVTRYYGSLETSSDNTLNQLLEPGAVVMFDRVSMIREDSSDQYMPEKTPTNASLKIFELNRPCVKPVTMMAKSLKGIGIDPGDFTAFKDRFKSAARDHRGWLGSVYTRGNLSSGDILIIDHPDKPEPSKS